MKILIIEWEASSKAGGAEKSMFHFINFLIDDRNEVFLACEVIDDYNVAQEKIIKINTQPPSIQGYLSYISNLSKIISFIKRNDINLIFTHCIHLFPFLRLIKLFTKTKIKVYFKWLYTKGDIGIINRWGGRCIDQVIAINPFIGNYWKSQLKLKTNIHYIADGIEFGEAPKNKGQLKLNDEINILFIGRIYEGKGLHLLIDALFKLPNNYKLTIVGKFNNHGSKVDPYENYIYSLIEDYSLKDRIDFQGFVKDVKDIYRNSNIVVVPSIIDDAQPLTVLEAFSLGVPAIASRSGGIPFMYEEPEVWLFNNDGESIASKIIYIIKLINDDNSVFLNQYHYVRGKYNCLETNLLLIDNLKNGNKNS